jgi:tetratricopeptide (TPR) repeat protein
MSSYISKDLPYQVAVLIVLILSVSVCNAQQNQRIKIDSVYALIQAKKTPDTNRVRLLNNYARMIRYDSADVAMAYADEGLMIAEKLNEELWIGQSLYSKAMIYSKKNDYAASLQYFDSAKIIFEKRNDTRLVTNCLSFIAEVYHTQGAISKAIDAFHEVIRQSEKTGNIREEGVAYGNIGNIYGDIDMHKDAILNYEKALDKFRQLGDSMLVGLVFHNLGYSNQNLEEYSKAKLYYDTAIHIFKQLSRPDAESTSSAGLGFVLGNMGFYKQGLLLLDSAIASNEIRNNRRFYAVSNISAAKVMMMGADNRNDISHSYSKALVYGTKGLNAAREIGDVNQQIYALKYLADIYNRLGNDNKAFETLKQYLTLRDSVAGINKRQEIAIKQAQFENEKKEAIIQANYTTQLNKQSVVRNFLLAGTALILSASLLLFIFYKRRRDAKAKQQEAELKAEIADTEMKVMRLQMNPHFIFNSLNSISDYIRKNNSSEADEYLSKFAKVMRMTLENSEQQAIPLEDDLKALELYIQLEAKRLSDKFTYQISVADDIDKENTLVPPMIFQPFVENSIWHGISKKEGKGHILIEIKKDGEMLHCLIDDDGIGRQGSAFVKEDVVKEKQSLGMKITKARIDMLNKLRGSKADIRITDKEKGLQAELILPVQTSF